jgi:hypothetical protein
MLTILQGFFILIVKNRHTVNFENGDKNMLKSDGVPFSQQLKDCYVLCSCKL